MFVPGVRQGSPVSERLFPFVLGSVVIGSMLLGWAFLAASPLANESNSVALPSVPPASIRSVAYSLPEDGRDRIYVRSIDGGEPRFVASFPIPYGFDSFRARGAASPGGERIAVLSVSDAMSDSAHLTIVSLPSAARTEVDAPFDLLAPIAWSADGTHLASIRTTASADPSRIDASIIEVDAATGDTRVAAQFSNVFQATPVGYSIDRERLFVVVIGQSGSTLYAVRTGGRVDRVAVLSASRTRDWSLSPDGARLAYIEVTAAGERTYAGRTLIIATGAIVNAESSADAYGSAWRPGGQAPDFGGPGGTIHLDSPSSGEEYILPASWAPDGSTMVATIYSARTDRRADPSESLELVTTTSRQSLADQPGARFMGWVANLD